MHWQGSRKLIGVIMQQEKKILFSGKISHVITQPFYKEARPAVNDDDAMCAMRHFNAIGNIIETHLHVLFIGS